MNREQWLALIRSHIERSGHHVTVVKMRETPRFGYTIGLTEAGLPELILPGATTLSVGAVGDALNTAADRLREGRPAAGSGFASAPVDRSWGTQMALGAFDVCGDDVTLLQLIPAERTIDVPDLARPFDARREPVWRWLVDDWELPVPPSSLAATNRDGLRGAPVTYAGRWEDDYWELMAGDPGEGPELLPLATMLGHDPSLAPVLRLAVGETIRREPGGLWEPWT